MNRKFLRVIFIGVSASVVIGVVSVLWVMFGLYPFLAQNDKIEAEVLVVEGWLPEYALEQAVEEYRAHPYKKIITTGGALDSIFRMPTNGNLHIYLPDSVTNRPPDSRILVDAQGTDIEGEYPHFSLWVNDTICVGEAYTWWHNITFNFPIDSGMAPITKVHIQYDNDGSKDEVDRDMYVKSVTVNGYTTGYLPAKAVYEYYSSHSKKKVFFSEKTWAERAASTLKGMGLSDQEVVAMPSPPVNVHRTYTSAIVLKEWLEENNIKSINIFSLGTHARRSRLSYKKVLRDYDDIEVGIIAVPSREYTPNNWWRKRRSAEFVMREALKYTYIQFFFDIV
jgi:hypothetical protein